METVDEIIRQIDMNGNIHEVAIIKEFDVLHFIIEIEANKANPYNVNSNNLKFTNDFKIKSFHCYAQTNALAGFIIKVNGVSYPSKFYFVSAATAMKTYPLAASAYARGYYCSNVLMIPHNVEIEIPKDSELEFYVYNTHTSAQQIYIEMKGYNIFKKILN